MKLQLWEWFVILVAYFLAIRLYVKSWAPKSVGTNTKRAFYAFFIFVLLTHWAFSPLTLFQDRNNAGDYWWTDPWRQLLSWPPLFSPLMWLLLVVAVVLYLVRLTVPTRLVIALMLFYAALGVDYTAGDGSDRAQPATTQESVKAACKAQIDGLAGLRNKIAEKQKGGEFPLDTQLDLVSDYRSNLAKQKCGRFTDIATPLTGGIAKFPRADSDTVMVVPEGYSGDGLLYQVQCRDSDQADAKPPTYEPDKLRCDYLGEKLGPIKLTVTDDYGRPEEFVEQVDTAAPVVLTTCPEGFAVRLPDRGSNGRLNVDGARTRGPNSEEDFRRQILEQAAVDPLTLFAYYQSSPLGDTAPLQDATVLVEGGDIKNEACYSNRGIAAYDAWATLWDNADLAQADTIAYQGFNTGVSGNTVTHSPGVTGSDKEGVNVAYRDIDGNVTKSHSALYRCTQPTTPQAPPGTPPGITDNPISDSPPAAVPPTITSPPGKDAPLSPVKPGSPEVTRGVDPPAPAPAPVLAGKDASKSPVTGTSSGGTTTTTTTDERNRGVDAPSSPAPQQSTVPPAPVASAQPTNPPEVSNPVQPAPTATTYPGGDPCATGC